MTWTGDDDEATDISPWPTMSPDVTETDNPVVARLIGPHGKTLIELRERRTVPFGYTKPTCGGEAHR